MYSAVSLWVMISVVLIFTFVMISFPLVQTKRISIFILSVNPPPVLFCISDTGIPTPHYNASVLSDMFYEQHLHYLYDCLVDFPGMKDAVALLKVWLHQRQFDQVCFIKVHTYCQGGNPYNKLVTLLAESLQSFPKKSGKRKVTFLLPDLSRKDGRDSASRVTTSRMCK